MKLVLVEWEDSHFASHGWQNRKELEALSLASCVSVGILVKQSKSAIHLILSKSEENVAQAMVIPKSSIKRMRELRVKDDI